MSERNGIAAAGNWIVDKVKIVDVLPGKGMLANIISETTSTGGAPANVLTDLARLGAPFPLTGIGVIGDDSAGRFILERMRDLGIDSSQMRIDPGIPTSYTDVMSERETGERSFFHYRGANATFSPAHVEISLLQCRILHLGYLLLLDRMDEEDPDYETVAARFLHDLREASIATSIDIVSEESQRFGRIVPAALRHVDYLFMNEIEASRTTGIPVRNRDSSLDAAALWEAVEALAGLGDMRLTAVHMPEGAVVRTRDGKLLSIGSLQLTEGEIAGTTGAGDAFCAGMLYGIHEHFAVEDSLLLATCCAGACLRAGDASSGVMKLNEMLDLARSHALRELPLEAGS